MIGLMCQRCQVPLMETFACPACGQLPTYKREIVERIEGKSTARRDDMAWETWLQLTQDEGAPVG